MRAIDISDHPTFDSDTFPKAQTNHKHSSDSPEAARLSPQTSAAAIWMESYLSWAKLWPSSRSDRDSPWLATNCSCVVAWKQIKKEGSVDCFFVARSKVFLVLEDLHNFE